MDATPANTLGYMIAGFAVIFGVMFFYLISLVVRWRNLRQDEQMLEEVEEQQNEPPVPEPQVHLQR